MSGPLIIDSCHGDPIYLADYVQLGPDVVAGRYIGVSPYTRIRHCKIGSFCCFGHRVSVNPFQHPISWLSTHGFQFSVRGFETPEYQALTKLPYESVAQRDVIIGNDVWVGDNAIVMASVGDGAIIGAGAVVTKDIPPYAVAVGMPAEVKYMRFPKRTVERLLRLKWWDMELSELDGLPFDDIERCLDLIEGKKAAA